MSRYSPSYGDYENPTPPSGYVSDEPWNYPVSNPYNDAPSRYERYLSYDLYRHTQSSNTPTGPRRVRSPDQPPVKLNPSSEYLDASSIPTSTAENPTRKLLILDLNGTLLYRSAHTNAGRTIYGSANTAKRPLRAVHPRPFMSTFRQFLFHPDTLAWLDTMVWSSAMPHSVEDMVGKAFETHKTELVAVWARDTLGLTSGDYNQKTQTIKDLRKPWAALGFSSTDETEIAAAGPSHLPETLKKVEHSAFTTLLLDDSHLKAQLQPHNHLCIQEYVYARRQSDLEALDTLRMNETQDHAKVKKAKRHKKAGKGKASSTSQDEVSTDGSTVIDSDQPSGKDTQNPEPRPEDPNISSANPNSLHVDQLQDGSETIRSKPQIDEFLPFDRTLIAIVGVLDAIKNESNVSNWIRTGNLLGPSRKVPPCPDEVATTPTTDFHPPSSPPPSSQLSLPDSNVEEPMWFDDEAVMEYWVARGLGALERLDIPVLHGLTHPNPSRL